MKDVKKVRMPRDVIRIARVLESLLESLVDYLTEQSGPVTPAAGP